MAEFELKALITGVDRLSPALSKMQKKIRGFKRQAEEASQGGLALGGGLAAGLTLSLKSYADQENAATGLKVAMMDANGEVGKRFQDINKLAIGLGTVRCISGRQGRPRGQAVLRVLTLKPDNGRRGRMKPPMWCRAGDRVTVRCGSPTSG